MNSRTLLMVMLVGAFLWRNQAELLALVSSGDKPAPAPAVADLDLVSVFGGSADDAQARTHAMGAACLADAMADVIEFDGRAEKPRLASAGAVEDYRVQMLSYCNRGWRYDALYPGFGSTVGGFLDRRIGTDGGQAVSGEQRVKWVNAYRDLAKAARHAAGAI